MDQQPIQGEKHSPLITLQLKKSEVCHGNDHPSVSSHTHDQDESYLYSKEHSTLIFFSVPSKAPTNFTGHNTSSTSLVIKWGTIPQDYIHGILLGYKIFYARTSVFNIPYETFTVSPEILTKELTDLWKYTEYCFRVAGFTRRGDGNLTDCLNITTDQDSK